MALLTNKYVHEEGETDFDGCYKLLNLPDGSIGYLAKGDDCRSSSTPPIRTGAVTAGEVKFNYRNDGSNYGDAIYLDGEELEKIDIVDTDEVEITEDLNKAVDDVIGLDSIYSDKAQASEWLLEAFDTVFREQFFYSDTWDIEPDNVVFEDEVDIEECHTVENENEGTCTYEGVTYYIVSRDVYGHDIDDPEEWVYAVKDGTELENNGRYYSVVVLRLTDDDRVEELREVDAVYNSVEKEVESD